MHENSFIENEGCDNHTPKLNMACVSTCGCDHTPPTHGQAWKHYIHIIVIQMNS